MFFQRNYSMNESIYNWKKFQSYLYTPCAEKRSLLIFIHQYLYTRVCSNFRSTLDMRFLMSIWALPPMQSLPSPFFQFWEQEKVAGHEVRWIRWHDYGLSKHSDMHFLVSTWPLPAMRSISSPSFQLIRKSCRRPSSVNTLAEASLRSRFWSTNHNMFIIVMQKSKNLS